MSIEKTDIFVYAHWLGMPKPVFIGILSVHQGKGRKSYSFEYDEHWLKGKDLFLLDPDIGLFSGPQFPEKKENFGIFLDSMPDTWGRTLMTRRASQIAKSEGRIAPVLHDIDFLLGVADKCRMGALRFKLDPNGPFLDDDTNTPVPPWTSVGELQHIADLALSVAEYFRLTPNEAQSILSKVLETVKNWEKTAKQVGISRSEIEVMQPAFRF